jgi:hypothetical protein
LKAQAPSGKPNNTSRIITVIKEREITQQELSTAKAAVVDSFAAPKWYPQQEEWVRDPKGSDNICFNYPLSLRFEGALDTEALHKALEEIVRRHEVFRSVFSIKDGKLMQNVLENFPVSISRMDLGTASEHQREARALELARQDARAAFDLRREPLLRATLVRMGAADHILLLTTHHLACDDWSTDILLGELAQLYSHFSSGRPSTLPEVNYHYSDFVRQQASHTQGAELEFQVDYWSARYRGDDPFHYIKTDHPRDTVQPGKGGLEETTLSAELDDATAQFSQKNGFSSFMIYAGAMLCLFHCYSAKEDVGVGICVANRNQEETEEVIGPLSNRILLRVPLPSRIAIREVLERVRKATWEAYSFQEIPYGELVEKAAPARKSNHNRLFQGLIAFTNAPKRSREFSGLKVSRFAFDPGIACCDFYICLRHDHGLRLAIQYDAGLFNRETIQQIVSDYEHILETIIRQPEVLLKDLRVSPGLHAAAQMIAR